MSELNFNVLGNTTDIQKETRQLHEALRGLSSDFKAFYAGAEDSIEGTEQLINHLRLQIDNTIATLNTLGVENQNRLNGLQSLSLGSADATQTEAIQSEIVARQELADSIETQKVGLNELGTELSEYGRKLKEGKEGQEKFSLGLAAIKEQLNGALGVFEAASGTLEVFGVKNEFLQNAMGKLQAAIAVTNGLQSVSTAIVNNASIGYNVLSKAKLWWRNVTLQVAAAQGVETVAAGAGTVANWGLAAAIRAVGLAIKSIPVFGWIAAGISLLIGVFEHFSSNTKEQIETQKKLNKEMDDFNSSIQNHAAKPIASIEILSNKFKALSSNVEAQKKFIADNKTAFDELGLAINNVSDAQRLLIDNKDQFVKAQIAKATSLAYMEKVQEKAKEYVREQTAADASKKAAAANSNNPKRQKEYERAATEHQTNADNVQKQMKDYVLLGMNQSLLAESLMPASGAGKGTSQSVLADIQQKQRQLQKLFATQALEGERFVQDMWNEIWQAEIDAMDEGSEKTLAQLQLNNEKRLLAIGKEKEDLIKKRKEEAKAVFDAEEDMKKAKNPNYVKKTFDDSQVGLTEEDNALFNMKYAVAYKRNAKDLDAYNAAQKKALNEALAAYGDYEQKCLAVRELAEEKKIGKSQEEQNAIDKQTRETLATIEKEANKEKDVFVRLFGDMRSKSVAEMRKIATDADEALAFIEKGEWDANKGKDFGIGENTFHQLHGSKEELEKVKKTIEEINTQADNCDTAFNQMAIGFDKLFKAGSDSKQLTESLSLIETGLNQAMQAGKLLSGALSNLGDAFGSDAMGEAADGIGVAMDAVGGAMSGAQAGAMFGPWGAAAGAAIGLVSSLAGSLTKLHDARHEKNIQQIQEQIEVLEKSYSNMGESIEKAYSSDASQLIEQQNTLLEQQKVLIRNQIAEERSKKKADADRIKEWENQIEEIDKLIGENKEKQIDAIMGSDVKSAIDDFAQAYADAWSAGDDRAKSSKDLVKQMIKQMIMEAMKATTSDKMEALRNRLAGFFSDGIISNWEREQIEKDAEAITRELDRKYGWADEYMQGDDKESTSQSGTSGGFETMSQETGSELNGRFTALQVSNEAISNSMLLALGNLSVLCTTASDGNILLAEMRNLALMSNSHLEDIAKYTKPILGFGEKLDRIERNTANL